jgi:hypothetical protein
LRAENDALKLEIELLRAQLDRVATVLSSSQFPPPQPSFSVTAAYPAGGIPGAAHGCLP